MNYQPKVNNIQQYSDSQGEHVVCKGKLILLKGGLDKSNRLTIKGEFFNPIIISETEEIKKGDWVYHPEYKTIYQWIKNADKNFDEVRAFKILALPEHFSDKHLQAIVDGKMEDGDEVYLKVYTRELAQYDIDVIHKDKQNHITLFPAQQYLEEAAKESANQYFPDKENGILNAVHINAFRDGAEWAKKNNY